jgi:hypothetical protein
MCFTATVNKGRARGAYSRVQLERMNRKFVECVRAAIAP